MRLRRSVLVFGLLIALSCPLARAEKEIGDPAPPLDVSAWIKGGAVDLAAGKGKNLYVIEFWATWCGPCKTSIPHLTELQRQYKDKGVVVVGISDEQEDKVKPFVKDLGDKMDYTVAVDKLGGTSRAYLDAFGTIGIPYAFIIEKQGRIAWHGHPLSVDDVVARMVDGKFDLEAAIASARAGKLMNVYFTLVQEWNQATDAGEKKRFADNARKAGETIITTAAKSADTLYEFSFNILLLPNTEYRDFELAGRVADAALKATPGTPADKARKLMHDYFRLLQSAPVGGQADGQKLAEIIRTVLHDAGPGLLNDFARMIISAPRTLKSRDLKLALRLAGAANAATREQDAGILDTYALACFVNGKRDQAIESVKKAIAVNKDKDTAERLKQLLDAYRLATLPVPASAPATQAAGAGGV